MSLSNSVLYYTVWVDERHHIMFRARDHCKHLQVLIMVASNNYGSYTYESCHVYVNFEHSFECPIVQLLIYVLKWTFPVNAHSTSKSIRWQKMSWVQSVMLLMYVEGMQVAMYNT